MGGKGQMLLQTEMVAQGAKNRELHPADPVSQTMSWKAFLSPPPFGVNFSGSTGTVWPMFFSAHRRAIKALPSSHCSMLQMIIPTHPSAPQDKQHSLSQATSNTRLVP